LPLQQVLRPQGLAALAQAGQIRRPKAQQALFHFLVEEKAADLAIRCTVTAHRDDRIYLEGAYRGQVNGEIQTAYVERERYEELSDLKYMDTGGIFDIMAVTVIQHHLSFAS
jgi:type I restriction enzyme R subunit